MKTVCDANKCVGCMACIDVCPRSAITIKDSLSAYNAVIHEDTCIECGACYRVCQNHHKIETLAPTKWYQGFAIDDKIRENASSGGLASEIERAFVVSGGYVCSCLFKGGEFIFAFTNRENELHQYTGSKYVKSNPIGIYKEIRSKLKDGHRILFVGLPCQVAAVRSFLTLEVQVNLYTIDLICHGTPSPNLLEIFLKENGSNLKAIKNIQFRKKHAFQVFDNNKAIVHNGICDRYMIGFLESLIYTENCYECQYAKNERVSDITLGDSWGSDMPLEEQKKGISLILCQTDKGRELLELSNLYLTNINVEKAIANNKQLKMPSVRPEGWNSFFDSLDRGKKFNSLVRRNLLKRSVRQDVKLVLYKLKILR